MTITRKGFTFASSLRNNYGRQPMAKRTDLLDKKKVLKSIKSLPDRFSVDDVVDRMIILEKLERAVADSEAGRTLILAVAKNHHAKWLK